MPQYWQAFLLSQGPCSFSVTLLSGYRTVHWDQPWFIFLLNCSHESDMQKKTVILSFIVSQSVSRLSLISKRCGGSMLSKLDYEHLGSGTGLTHCCSMGHLAQCRLQCKRTILYTCMYLFWAWFRWPTSFLGEELKLTKGKEEPNQM